MPLAKAAEVGISGRSIFGRQAFRLWERVSFGEENQRKAPGARKSK